MRNNFFYIGLFLGLFLFGNLAHAQSQKQKELEAKRQQLQNK